MRIFIGGRGPKRKARAMTNKRNRKRRSARENKGFKGCCTERNRYHHCDICRQPACPFTWPDDSLLLEKIPNRLDKFIVCNHCSELVLDAMNKRNSGETELRCRNCRCEVKPTLSGAVGQYIYCVHCDAQGFGSAYSNKTLHLRVKEGAKRVSH